MREKLTGVIIKRVGISLAVVCSFIASFFVFQDQIIPFVIKRFIHNRAQDVILEDFSYAKCKWRKDRFVLTKVNFNVETPTLQGSIKAENCSFCFSWKQGAKAYFSFDTPQLKLKVDPSSSEAMPASYEAVHKLLFPAIAIEIKTGHCDLDVLGQLYSFDFAMPLDYEKTLEVTELKSINKAFGPDVSESKKGSAMRIMLKKQRDSKRFMAQLHIDHFDMALLNIPNVAPSFINQLRQCTYEGELRGDVEIAFSNKKGLRALKADLFLQEAKLRHKEHEALISVKRGRCFFEGIGQQKKEPTALSLIPGLEFLNHYGTFGLDIEEGYVGCSLGSSGECIELKNIDIKTDYNNSYLNHHHLKANLHCGDTSRPILMMGSESKSKSNFYRQSIEEEKNVDRWQCFFSFAHHGTSRCLDYSLELLTASKAELFALVQLKKWFFSDKEYLSVGADTLKTYIRGELSDQHHYLRVHYLAAENVMYQKGVKSFRANRCGVRCNLDLKKKNFYKHGSWDLNIEEGFFEEGKHPFESICFQGGMNGTYVKPSRLTFSLLDKKTECLFEGLISHLNVDIETSFLPLEVKRFFSSTICLESKTPLASHEVKTHISLGLDATFSQIRTEGVCKLFLDKHEAQEIEFGLNFAGGSSVLEWPVWPSYEFLMGWFKADDLDADVVNLAFYLLDKEWQCGGYLDIEGSINQQIAQINIDPTKLRFTSDMATLYQDPNSNKRAPRLNFTFDYLTNVWTGMIPLDGVCFDLPSFGLQFFPFSSKLELNDKVFTFRDVKASHEGIDFTSHMMLDFFEPDRAKLTLSCNRAEGSVAEVIKFLHHFDPFEFIDIPGQGHVELGSDGSIQLEAIIGETDELTSLDLKAQVIDYKLSLSPSCYLDRFKASILYDSSKDTLLICDGEGIIEGESIRSKGKDWRLKLKEITFNVEQNKGEGRLLLSSPTYDLIEFNSQFEKKKEDIFITCNPQTSHFFGSQVDKLILAFDDQINLKAFDIGGEISSLSLYGFLDLVTTMQWVAMPSKLLTSIRSPQFGGQLSYKCSGKEYYKHVDMQIKGSDVQIGKVRIPKVNIAMTKRDEVVDIAHCEVGGFALVGGAIVRNNRAMTSNVSMNFKDNFCHVGEGSFIEKGRISFKDSFFTFQKGGSDLPFLKQYKLLDNLGKIKGDGNIEVVFSEGLDSVRCFGKVGMALVDCVEKGVFVDTLKPFSFELDALGGLKVYDVECYMKAAEDPNVWIKTNLAEGYFDLFGTDHEYKLSTLHLIVPPESAVFLAKKGYIPFLETGDKGIHISGTDFAWENQIDMEVDIAVGKKIEVEASIKEGYYWLGHDSWFLEKTKIEYDGQTVVAYLAVKKDAIDLQIKAKGGWQKDVFATVEVLDLNKAEGQPLVCALSSNDSEGVFIQSIEGDIFGLNCSFYHNPRESLVDKMVLTGGMRIDAYTLSKYLPQTMQAFIEKFEIGRGYELSGDIVIHKLFSSLDSSHFSGFFKGKHMEFCGSEVDTLMSEIRIYPHLIELSNCHISDTAGLFEIPEMRIEQTMDDRWRLLMGKLHVQDFRPSLIKKVGVYRGKIKPLVIRDFCIEEVEGYIDDLNSFQGSGQFSFINTFKRDTHILDIPLEILGRLGLDMGLLIPVRGSMRFLLEGGIVHFLDLQKSYSYGDRSEFFLSKKELSYIDLEGNLNVHIKMKQHVLLKITQPFTLSILGDIKNPKYSLH